jgi:predicted protein tyrosine phosphatase
MTGIMQKPEGWSYYDRIQLDGLQREDWDGLRVVVMGQSSAEKYIPENDDEVCISIVAVNPFEDGTPPRRPILNFREGNVLRMYFDDRPDDKENSPKFAGAKLITLEQAEQMGEFIWNNRNKKKIVVHCMAGVSRSRSTAAAIAAFFDLPYKYTVFNSRVYHLVAHALLTQKLREIYAGLHR